MAKFEPDINPAPLGTYPNLPPPTYDESIPSAPPSFAPINGQDNTNIKIVVDNGKFGPYPRTMKCYHCGDQVVTNTEPTPATLTYLLSTLICIVGCFCGCCLVPCCVPSCQDIIHKCPNCKKFLGAYERIKMRRR